MNSGLVALVAIDCRLSHSAVSVQGVNHVLLNRIEVWAISFNIRSAKPAQNMCLKGHMQDAVLTTTLYLLARAYHIYSCAIKQKRLKKGRTIWT